MPLQSQAHRRDVRAALGILLLASLAAAAPLAAAPGHRLDHDVVPVSEALHLVLDPARVRYTGRATIELAVAAATDSFRFHALGLELEAVTLRDTAGAVVLRWTSDDRGVVTARAARPLRPGHATLVARFANDYDLHSNSLYRFESGGRQFLASQFEAVAAREAFPCWDEPEFKIPWDVTVVTPAANLVVANTLPRRVTRSAAGKTVAFRRTRPLPSYLLNLCVGPYVTRTIPGLRMPGRIVTVPGQLSRADAAVEETPKALASLERWFGRDYPYDKLDLIALPEYIGGAMENAAAITFYDRVLLLDPKTTSVAQRAAMFETLAHELAHMWFGDLVTMQWWDDLWLNESFANMMSTRVAREVHPDYRAELSQRDDAESAFNEDARASTRAIRAPVDAHDNLDLLFDEFAYEKGEAVLGMIEDWLGEATFREGVRDYLSAHADRNAVADDLWRALAARSGQDLAPVTKSFFDQAGVPIVTATTDGPGRVRLRQQRFVPIGRKSDATRWSIPVALRGGARDAEISHVRLDSVDTAVKPAGDDFPLHPNAGERGYYRWSAPEESMRALSGDAARRLTPRERIGFVRNLGALLRGGRLHADDYFWMLSPMADDSEADVVTAVTGELDEIRETLIEDSSRTNFAHYVRETLQPALRRFGLTPAPDEPAPVARLRPSLLLALADLGQDDAVFAACLPLARQVLTDSGAVAPSLASAALAVAAMRADTSLFGQLTRAYVRAKDPGDQRRLLGAIASVRAPELVDRALHWSLSGALRPQEMLSLLYRLRVDPANEERVYAFVTEHYAEITKRLPEYAVPGLTNIASGASLARLERAKAFFADPAHRVNGTEVELAKVEAAVIDRVALREAELTTATRFLYTAMTR